MNTIVVSPTGDCQNISTAIRTAKAGDRILVKPGVYKENLVIDKPLEIIGDGEVADIVVESKKADCIFMKTDNALVRGLSLRNRAKGRCVVYIPQGKLRLEYCDITSNMFTCIEINGSEAEGIVSYCKINDGKQGGVFVYKNGRGTIENCDIFGNAYSGIRIKKGGNPVVQNCTIKQNAYEAVWVSNGGKGTIENCDLRNNAEAAWDIESGCQVQRSGNNE